MSISTSYLVSGMTCGHCVSSVSEEVGAIAGVDEVRVDLASGRLVVISDRDVSFAEVEAAVEEAGYSVTTA